MFQGTLDERGNPLLEDIPILFRPITERLEERPEVTMKVSFERNPLDFHKCIHKFVKSISAVRQRVETVSKEELRCRVDREASR